MITNQSLRMMWRLLGQFGAFVGCAVFCGTAGAQSTEMVKLEPGVLQGASLYGSAIDVANGRLVIGNAMNARAIDVHERTGSGWARVATVAAPPSFSPSAQLGISVSTDGEWIAAGAWLDQGGIGSVYLVHQAGGAWNSGQRIVPPTQELATFGSGIALRGNLLVVGAPRIDGGVFRDEGRVYIYEWHGTWTLIETLAPPSGDVLVDLYHFGNEVAVNEQGQIFVVAPDRGRGAVYVYDRVAAGGWALRTTLREPNPTVDDLFGISIASDAGVLVVGKRRDGNINRPGHAIVFERSPQNDWIRTAVLEASDGYANGDHGDQFGSSVDVDDGVIAVGAIYGRGNGAQDGAVYLFRRSASGTWPLHESERFVTSDAINGGLGGAVGLDQGILAAGADHRPALYAATFVFAAGREDDVALPPSGAAAGECRLETFGGPGVGDVGFIMAQCAPGTRYAVFGGLVGSAGGCGPAIGGMHLCVCGPLHRLGFGVVSLTSTLDFLDVGELSPMVGRLMGHPGTIYAQALVAQPGGAIGFTNAIELRIW